MVFASSLKSALASPQGSDIHKICGCLRTPKLTEESVYSPHFDLIIRDDFRQKAKPETQGMLVKDKMEMTQGQQFPHTTQDAGGDTVRGGEHPTYPEGNSTPASRVLGYHRNPCGHVRHIYAHGMFRGN
ncbi:hypothetical protein M404DRAFT_991901 [Pisolithus tinctorius Marx 270]|uniref:Uncharacterized protein n=1 Tax=Pisolithus tinctorius Marx 270 TaxID=870435 RepID=A0A0C3L076_PISTI|nr:hypothetical protein M404DRAFT_991901 [Pisolithus tinctorius Marx 270]